MFDSHRSWMSFRTLLAASVLLLTPLMAKGQDPQTTSPLNTPPSSADLTNEVRALTGLVRELQTQVQSLQSQVSELSANGQNKETIAHAPATQHESVASSQVTVPASGLGDPYSVFPAAEQSAASQVSNTAVTPAPADQTVEGRISNSRTIKS